MPNIPTMSLKTAQLNPVVFTPSQYEYHAADMGFLERSLAQKEARMKEAAQNKAAIDRTLGEIETKLNPSEAEWFEGYKSNIKNQVQSSIDSGDYGAAIRNATSLASSVLQDPRILGRMRAQDAYEKELQTQQARRDRGEISQNTFDWWVKNNKYSYTDNTDASGNYIEGSPWKAESTPVKDLSWAEHAATAYKLITPKKGSTTRGGGHSTTNIDGTGDGNKWSRSNSTEEITVEDILENIDELLSSAPDGYRQAEQAYNVARFDLERLQKQYDNLADDDPNKTIIKDQLDVRKELMYKNQAPISYKEYYARMVTNNRYAHTLAYKWTTSGNENFKSNDYQSAGSGVRGSIGTGVPYNRNTGFWKGAPVRFNGTYNFGILGQSADKISFRFSKQPQSQQQQQPK
jgi:hypothetical protein|nr:MAG TPA: hypothetical protein [Crassvirales sp.]